MTLVRTAAGVALAASMALLSGSAAQAANILANAGFETGALEPWYQSVDGNPGAPYVDWHVTSADAHSGSYSASDDGNKQLQQNFSPVLGSNITQLSLWVKQPYGPSISYVQLFFSDGTRNGQTIFPTITWGFFDLTNLVVQTKYVTGLGIFGYNRLPDPTPNRTLVDDVTLSTGNGVPEPATWMSMLVGFAGLGALMRRRRGVVAS